MAMKITMAPGGDHRHARPQPHRLCVKPVRSQALAVATHSLTRHPT
jgi:hypothetical protein